MCPLGHNVRRRRHLRRMPEDGFPRGRHHARLVRRAGHSFLRGSQPHSRGDGLRRAFGAGHRVGREPGAHPRGFGHRHHLVGGHGRRGALHEPQAGLHLRRPLGLPVRQHRHRDARRRRGARHPDRGHHGRGSAVAAPRDVRGFRPRLRPQPRHPYARDLLRHGGAGRRHDRPLDPHHGHRAAHLAAHHARRHRQRPLQILPHHRARRPAGRRGRQCGRTGRKLQFRSSARGGHNIYPHPYAYYSKTITFASEKAGAAA